MVAQEVKHCTKNLKTRAQIQQASLLSIKKAMIRAKHSDLRSGASLTSTLKTSIMWTSIYYSSTNADAQIPEKKFAKDLLGGG